MHFQLVAFKLTTIHRSPELLIQGPVIVAIADMLNRQVDIVVHSISKGNKQFSGEYHIVAGCQLILKYTNQ